MTHKLDFESQQVENLSVCGVLFLQGMVVEFFSKEAAVNVNFEVKNTFDLYDLHSILDNILEEYLNKKNLGIHTHKILVAYCCT